MAFLKVIFNSIYVNSNDQKNCCCPEISHILKIFLVNLNIKPAMIKTSLDPEKLECMANKLKALGHPVRIAIIDLLEKNEKLTVTAIQSHLKIEQAATSNHLRILKDQQIVKSVRDGKNKYYSLKLLQLADIVSCVEKCAD